MIENKVLLVLLSLQKSVHVGNKISDDYIDTGRGSINETSYKPPTDTTAILIVIALICILVILCCVTLCICVFAMYCLRIVIKFRRKRKDLPVQL